MMPDRHIRLRELRLDLGLSQAMMADKMGLPTRTYEDLEAGRSKVRPIHMRAAMMAALIMAEAERNAELIPHEVRHMVGVLAELVGSNKKPA